MIEWRPFVGRCARRHGNIGAYRRSIFGKNGFQLLADHRRFCLDRLKPREVFTAKKLIRREKRKVHPGALIGKDGASTQRMIDTRIKTAKITGGDLAARSSQAMFYRVRKPLTLAHSIFSALTT